MSRLPPQPGDDPRTIIRRLYYRKDGFEIPKGEAKRVRDARSSALYGELMPTAVMRLLEYLELGPKDVLYDLGSGVGKVVLQAAITHPLKRCVGIELAATRVGIARDVLHQAQTLGLLKTSDCDFQEADFMSLDLSDATVAYTCSTAFSQRYLTKLSRQLAIGAPGRRLVSLQDLDDTRHFELETVLRLDASWRRRTKVHVYRLMKPLKH